MDYFLKNRLFLMTILIMLIFKVNSQEGKKSTSEPVNPLSHTRSINPSNQSISNSTNRDGTESSKSPKIDFNNESITNKAGDKTFIEAPPIAMPPPPLPPDGLFDNQDKGNTIDEPPAFTFNNRFQPRAGGMPLDMQKALQDGTPVVVSSGRERKQKPETKPVATGFEMSALPPEPPNLPQEEQSIVPELYKDSEIPFKTDVQPLPPAIDISGFDGLFDQNTHIAGNSGTFPSEPHTGEFGRSNSKKSIETDLDDLGFALPPPVPPPISFPETRSTNTDQQFVQANNDMQDINVRQQIDTKQTPNLEQKMESSNSNLDAPPFPEPNSQRLPPVSGTSVDLPPPPFSPSFSELPELPPPAIGNIPMDRESSPSSSSFSSPSIVAENIPMDIENSFSAPSSISSLSHSIDLGLNTERVDQITRHESSTNTNENVSAHQKPDTSSSKAETIEQTASDMTSNAIATNEKLSLEPDQYAMPSTAASNGRQENVGFESQSQVVETKTETLAAGMLKNNNDKKAFGIKSVTQRENIINNLHVANGSLKDTDSNLNTSYQNESYGTNLNESPRIDSVSNPVLENSTETENDQTSAYSDVNRTDFVKQFQLQIEESILGDEHINHVIHVTNIDVDNNTLFSNLTQEFNVSRAVHLEPDRQLELLEDVSTYSTENNTENEFVLGKQSSEREIVYQSENGTDHFMNVNLFNTTIIPQNENISNGEHGFDQNMISSSKGNQLPMEINENPTDGNQNSNKTFNIHSADIYFGKLSIYVNESVNVNDSEIFHDSPTIDELMFESTNANGLMFEDDTKILNDTTNAKFSSVASESDNVNATESITTSESDINVNVTKSITTSESNNVNVTESITTSESDINVNVTKSITTSESNNVNVTESITTSESDNVNVTESITTHESILANDSLSWNESDLYAQKEPNEQFQTLIPGSQMEVNDLKLVTKDQSITSADQQQKEVPFSKDKSKDKSLSLETDSITTLSPRSPNLTHEFDSLKGASTESPQISLRSSTEDLRKQIETKAIPDMNLDPRKQLETDSTTASTEGPQLSPEPKSFPDVNLPEITEDQSFNYNPSDLPSDPPPPKSGDGWDFLSDNTHGVKVQQQDINRVKEKDNIAVKTPSKAKHTSLDMTKYLQFLKRDSQYYKNIPWQIQGIKPKFVENKKTTPEKRVNEKDSTNSNSVVRSMIDMIEKVRLHPFEASIMQTFRAPGISMGAPNSKLTRRGNTAVSQQQSTKQGNVRKQPVQQERRNHILPFQQTAKERNSLNRPGGNTRTENLHVDLASDKTNHKLKVKPHKIPKPVKKDNDPNTNRASRLNKPTTEQQNLPKTIPKRIPTPNPTQQRPGENGNRQMAVGPGIPFLNFPGNNNFNPNRRNSISFNNQNLQLRESNSSPIKRRRIQKTESVQGFKQVALPEIKPFHQNNVNFVNLIESKPTKHMSATSLQDRRGKYNTENPRQLLIITKRQRHNRIGGKDMDLPVYHPKRSRAYKTKQEKNKHKQNSGVSSNGYLHNTEPPVHNKNDPPPPIDMSLPHSPAFQVSFIPPPPPPVPTQNEAQLITPDSRVIKALNLATIKTDSSNENVTTAKKNNESTTNKNSTIQLDPSYARELNNPDEICSNCTYVSNFCYLREPTNCNRFRVCYRQGHKIRATEKECSFGLFWSQSRLACIQSTRADCETDPCGKGGTRSHPYIGKCRAYWTCRRKRSDARCCPNGYSYGGPQKACVPDDTCATECFTVSKEKSDVCPLLAMPDSPFEYVDGGMVRECASGTRFEQSACTCIRSNIGNRSSERKQKIENTVEDLSCNPVVKLDFSGHSRDAFDDKSGNPQSIGVFDIVQTMKEQAMFNGRGSLKLWRFSNVQLGPEFAARFKFYAHGQSHRSETLMSNCIEKNEAAFDIRLDTSILEIVFTVKTVDSPEATMRMFYQAYQWNEVILRYDGHSFSAAIGPVSKTIFIEGVIPTKHAAISVGGCDQDDGFIGYMDDIIIYNQCIPEDLRNLVFE